MTREELRLQAERELKLAEKRLKEAQVALKKIHFCVGDVVYNTHHSVRPIRKFLVRFVEDDGSILIKGVTPSVSRDLYLILADNVNVWKRVID